MKSTELKAPFPYFGGKRRVADVVWRAFGNPPNYIEPFFGSGAVFLNRPGGAGKIETINDLDCHLANFWRAVQLDPDGVADFSDWPVNEADMHARHAQMMTTSAEFRERMHSDPEHYDAKLAGWWCWGMSTAIGGNWLRGESTRAMPRVCGWVTGNGMHALPAIGHSGRGVHSPERVALREWMGALASRLRRTRVACGDWTRVLSGAVTGESNTLKNMGMSPCAVFFDAPYGEKANRTQCYAEDSLTVADDVAAWAIAHGDDPHFRIAVCGYEGEHDFPESWRCHAWKATGGHGNRAGNQNRTRERIWFSPHCLDVEKQQALFAEGE